MVDYLATDKNGKIKPIHDCWIKLQVARSEEDRIDQADISIQNLDAQGYETIELYALPEISEKKSATYADQQILGRTSPVKTYTSSSDRSISMTIHLYVTCEEDISRNLGIIRKISSLTHPEYRQTYLPPRMAKIKCGQLLSSSPDGVPVLLKDYSINYETKVQWFYSEKIKTYMPLHVSIQTNWDIIYSWQSLPGADDVLEGKY